MIKLLVFDVDGTLYDLNRHEIQRSCRDAIAQAKQNGLIFVIATGRTHYGLGAALNALNPDYILAVNGAVVADGQGRILAHHDLSRGQVERVNAFCRSFLTIVIFINIRRRSTGCSRRKNRISDRNRLSTVPRKTGI